MKSNRAEPVTHEIMITRVKAILQLAGRNLQAAEVCEKGCSTSLSPAMFAAALKRYLQDNFKDTEVSLVGDKVELKLGGGLAKRFSPDASQLDVPFGDFWAKVSEVYSGTKGILSLDVPESQMAILPFARIVNKPAVGVTRSVEVTSSLRYGAGNSWG